MGIKGEGEGGFPQPKPAFILTVDWDAAHRLGPTTHPKNLLSYVKVYGTMKSIKESGLPPFDAEIVDCGAWVQQEYLSSGETVARSELSTLIRVINPPAASADPAIAETETGLIRLKWSVIANIFGTLQPVLDRDVTGFIRETQKKPSPGGTVSTLSFQTGDHRYKFLEHAVYVGKGNVTLSTESVEGEPKMISVYYISYLMA